MLKYFSNSVNLMLLNLVRKGVTDADSHRVCVVYSQRSLFWCDGGTLE